MAAPTHIRDILARLTLQADTNSRAFAEREPLPICDLAAKHPWKYATYHPDLKDVFPSAVQFASDVLSRAEPYWLTILGPSGIGKTFMLGQVFRFLRRYEAAWKIRTSTGTRLPSMAWLKPADDLTDYAAPRDYSHRDLCYIEDIGAGSGLDKGSGSVLAGRIAELLQLRTGKWTLIDANLSREEIANKIDPRIASRLKRDGSVLLQIPDSVPDFNDQ